MKMNEYRERDLDTHVKILGWLYILSSALMLVMGFLGLLFLAGIGLFGAIESTEPEVFAILTFLGTMGLIFFGLLSLPGLAAGYGLLKHKSWGRILTLIVAFFKLFDFPLGTALATYTFWVLIQDDASAYFAIPKAA
jgi:hypothetical protein